ncbi:hypothetical protein POM88_001661 [Heracleum sosnowskyi]|uniref:Uncharacterized protein n=1 Tax=Heracleum sosnowskyi TaxID=360622 RepID=A0AAD8JGA3_9APIA|nr:hypothetical protein POM88_001661 [Heracleum sosnowskyi]
MEEYIVIRWKRYLFCTLVLVLEAEEVISAEFSFLSCSLIFVEHYIIAMLTLRHSANLFAELWLVGSDMPSCRFKSSKSPTSTHNISLVAIDLQSSKFAKTGKGKHDIPSFTEVSKSEPLPWPSDKFELCSTLCTRAQLILTDCVNLVEIDKSINTAGLVLSDLKNCNLLKRHPKDFMHAKASGNANHFRNSGYRTKDKLIMLSPACYGIPEGDEYMTI